jgi:hypothetical protein
MEGRTTPVRPGMLQTADFIDHGTDHLNKERISTQTE